MRSLRKTAGYLALLCALAFLVAACGDDGDGGGGDGTFTLGVSMPFEF